jgi:hypothetical protein
MNTNQKGSLGLIRVISDLYNKGYHCFTPFDDYSPVDCIAMKPDGKVVRLQVKFRSPDKNDRYELMARSVINGKSISIDRSLIDAWAIYLSDIDSVIYFPIHKMEGKGTHYIKRTEINELINLEDSHNGIGTDC